MRCFGGLAWQPSGQGIVFSSNRTGLCRLWHVGLDGALQRLTVPAQDPGSPTFGLTGLLAFAEWRYDTNVRVASAGDSASARAVQVTTQWGGLRWQPVAAPPWRTRTRA